MQRDDHLKRAWCWERLRAGGEGDNRGWDGWWHHWLNAHEFGSTLGVGDDRQAWCAAIHGVVKSRTRLSNWTELKKYKLSAKELSSYKLSKMLTCSLSTWGMSGTAAFLLSPVPEDLSSLPSPLPLPSAVRSSSCLFTRFKPLHTSYCMVLLVAQTIKWVPTMQETRVQSLVGKISWRRKWQPTPVLLPGKSHGWRNLVGYSPWGRKDLDTTERFHFHFHFPLYFARFCTIRLKCFHF